mmetsp:Transcript_39676/g.67997  ORF Transcript_39676/g.67997 Transcript_39676/m.67997 type:complete len:244 (-) Transcript_39676:244-975(-)
MCMCMCMCMYLSASCALHRRVDAGAPDAAAERGESEAFALLRVVVHSSHAIGGKRAVATVDVARVTVRVAGAVACRPEVVAATVAPALTPHGRQVHVTDRDAGALHADITSAVNRPAAWQTVDAQLLEGHDVHGMQLATIHIAAGQLPAPATGRRRREWAFALDAAREDAKAGPALVTVGTAHRIVPVAAWWDMSEPRCGPDVDRRSIHHDRWGIRGWDGWDMPEHRRGSNVGRHADRSVRGR